MNEISLLKNRQLIPSAILTILVITLNLVIVIGAGHGILFFGMIEFFALQDLMTGDFEFDLSGRYDDRLFTVALLSSLGQAVLVSSLFQMKVKIRAAFAIFGSVYLLALLAVLTQDAAVLNLDMITLVSSLSFIITALALIIKTSIHVKKNQYK